VRDIINHHPPRPVFSYSGVAKGSGYEAWREEFCRHFCRLDAAPTAAERIECTMEISQVGSLSFGETHGSSGSFLRTRSLLSDGSDDIVLLTAIEGKVLAVQRGRSIELRPSQMCLLSLDHVGESTLGEGSGYTALRMPRRELMAVYRNIEDKLVRPIGTSAAMRDLVGGYSALCFEMGQALEPTSQHTMAQHMIELVALMLETSADASSPATGNQHGPALFQLIQAHVLESLDDCDLSITAIARHARMSPRQIQRLFEQAGSTFSEFVLEQRLKLACRLLVNAGGRSEKISSIAHDAGFGDISYFHRSFRKRFGMTPSEWRHDQLPPLS
jgi:AraC-like DNA-binding protein